MDFYVVIPARFASTRLPGKPLLPIEGKPMVARVAEQAKASGAKEVWIATDHPTIFDVARGYNLNACMTRTGHNSGTDRIAEVVERQKWPDDTIVVNVQGDEPLIPPELIRAVAQHLHAHPDCAIATACHPVRDEAAWRNPNVVKAVLDKNGNALYFSRAPIPWPRDGVNDNHTALRHIGIYAYRASFLRVFHQLAPAPIEQTESLEQLRALWHGYRIGVAITATAPPAGVDTEEDLQVVRSAFKTLRKQGRSS